MVKITDKNFKEEVLESKTQKVIIDFWATWCEPCKKVDKSLQKIKDSMDGAIKIGRVNVEENPSLTARFNVRNLPTLFLFKNGKVQETIIGGVSLKKIKERFNI